MTAATTGTPTTGFDALRALCKAGTRPAIVTVPAATFLMVDGEGYPGENTAWAAALSALYSLSYTIKFALKHDTGLDYRLGALEALWWADDMATFAAGSHDGWKWTVMIAQPPEVTPEVLERARAEIRRRKPDVDPDLARLEEFEEGLCAQIMHVDPYSAEGPTIAALHTFIEETGHVLTGKHHEIYLGDPRRADPAKLRTVIRQPVRPRPS